MITERERERMTNQLAVARRFLASREERWMNDPTDERWDAYITMRDRVIELESALA